MRLEEQFVEFHKENPHVYDKLREFALTIAASGKRSAFGIAAVFERLRWFAAFETAGTYKLNNSFRAFYARLLMEQEPELAGLFRTRRSVADARQEAMAA